MSQTQWSRRSIDQIQEQTCEDLKGCKRPMNECLEVVPKASPSRGNHYASIFVNIVKCYLCPMNSRPRDKGYVSTKRNIKVKINYQDTQYC